MPSPFPGMDPFIEAQASWQGFHGRVTTYIGDQIAERLPGNYLARIEEQVRLEAPDEEMEVVRPDVLVARHRGASHAAERERTGTSTLAPVAVPFAQTHPTFVRQRRVEIRRLPEMSLVTVIEVLSPGNKVGKGREEYLAKRELLLEQAIHLVEIDLLLGGQRLPMGGPLPSGDYYAFVARVERWPSCDVYAWTVRDPLPTIPIPLARPIPTCRSTSPRPSTPPTTADFTAARPTTRRRSRCRWSPTSVPGQRHTAASSHLWEAWCNPPHLLLRRSRPVS